MAIADAKNATPEYEKVAPRIKRGKLDLPFMLLVLILLSIGVVMVLSASFASAYYERGDPMYFFVRQFGFAVVGVGVMYLFSRLPMTFYRNLSMPLLAFSVGLLILVLFIGEERNFSKRWFNLGFTTFQPSEIAKVAVIMAFAVMICKYGGGLRKFRLSHWKDFVKSAAPFVLVLGVIVALLLAEPHKSAAIITVAIAAVVLFAGGFDIRFVFAALIVAAIAVFVIVTKAEASYAEIAESGTGNYAFRRIVFWLHPEADSSGGGYQVLQSLYAVGSGGLTGLGLGQSRQKYLYLPEEHNDYIFAIVCEELGLIGAMLILVLFAVLIVRGFWIALHARTKFDALVAAGIVGKLAVQVFLNVSVVTNFIPCTGISLPFFSVGGTALLIQLAEMGVLMSISRDMELTRAG